MAALGLQLAPLVSDADRVPSWPEGVVGSITHTDAWCAVAVGRSSQLAGIGIAVETRKELSPELWPRTCRPEELEWLGRRSTTERGLLAKGIFSAKESLYKALFPRVRRYLEFESVTLRLEPQAAAGSFVWHAELRRDYGPHAAGDHIGPGKLCIEEPFVCSALCLWKGGAG
jgi:4'-phosphopantetheinyl transferase EntD